MDGGDPLGRVRSQIVTSKALPHESLLSQQHVHCATAAICPRRIRVREYSRMAPQILPHARLEDGHVVFGMQSAPVDDTDASVAAAPAIDELFHARDGFLGRLAVQVEHTA